jgi:hypothetical protein
MYHNHNPRWPWGGNWLIEFLAKSNSEREYLAPLYIEFCNLMIPLNISIRRRKPVKQGFSFNFQ